jgi:hypothetical protein
MTGTDNKNVELHMYDNDLNPVFSGMVDRRAYFDAVRHAATENPTQIKRKAKRAAQRQARKRNRRAER